jgi:3-oxoacyl-ACP reductase-like protein
MVIAALFASALSLQLIADPAPPAKPAAATAGAAAKPNAFAEQDKVVCIKTEITGTLLTKKVCRTKAEWDQLKQDSQDLTRDITGGGHSTQSPMAGS